MTTHRFVDAAPLLGTRMTKDGYLVANAKAARIGLQTYDGAEFGMPELGRISVYRPEDAVFSRDSLATFAGKPVTRGHPTAPVTAETWKDVAIGSIGSEVLRDGDFIRVPLTLMDADAIRQVQEGRRELSVGYETALTIEDGVTPDGEPFQARMSAIRVNHLALVARGRAGPEVRIGDAEHQTWGASPIALPVVADAGPITETHHMSTRVITVDGLQVETTDAGAAAIEKLTAERQAALDSATTAKATATTDAQAAKTLHDEAIAKLDGEIAAKDARIADLEKQVVTGDALDALVAARSTLVAKARAIATDADFSGKTDHEIRTAAVAAARGPDFAADKSEAYIAVAFDMLEEPKPDAVRLALATRTPAADAADDHGQSAYNKRLSDAWKGTNGAAA